MSLNDIAGQLTDVVGMLKNNDPAQVAELFAQKNPKFRDFMNKYRNSTIEEIAQSEGVNIGAVKTVLRMLGIR